MESMRQVLAKFSVVLILLLAFLILGKTSAHAAVIFEDNFAGISGTELHAYDSNYKYRSDLNDAILTTGGATSGDSSFSEDMYILPSPLADMSATVHVTNASRVTNVMIRTNLSSLGNTFTYPEKQDYGCVLEANNNLTMFLDNFGSASTLGVINLPALSTGDHYLTAKAVGDQISCSVDGVTYLTRTDSTIPSGSAGLLTQPDVTVSKFVIEDLSGGENANPVVTINGTSANVFDDNFIGTSGTPLHAYNNNYYYRSDLSDGVLSSGGMTSGGDSFSEDFYQIGPFTDMSATLYTNSSTEIPNVMIRTNLSSSGSTFTYPEKQDYGCVLEPNNDLSLFSDNFGSGTILGRVSLSPLTGSGHYITATAVGNKLSCAVDGVTYITKTDNTISSGGAAILSKSGVTNTRFVITRLNVPTTISVGSTYTKSGSFSDLDSSNWTATVDYGDGSGAQALSLSGNNFNLSHQYSSVGTYTVTVNVKDDEDAVGTATATVIVVPAVSNLNPVSDTYLKQGSQNENEGNSTFLRLQQSGNNRALVKFDQSQIQAAVGNPASFTAKLRFTISDNGNNWGSTGRTISLHELTKDWAEGNGFIENHTPKDKGTGSGSTWNCAVDSNISNSSQNCSGSTEWNMTNSASWSFNSTATDIKTIQNNQTGVIEFDVTSDVVDYLNSPSSNHGWLLKKTNESQAGKVEFGSRESSIKPVLIITNN